MGSRQGETAGKQYLTSQISWRDRPREQASRRELRNGEATGQRLPSVAESVLPAAEAHTQPPDFKADLVSLVSVLSHHLLASLSHVASAQTPIQSSIISSFLFSAVPPVGTVLPLHQASPNLHHPPPSGLSCGMALPIWKGRHLLKEGA